MKDKQALTEKIRKLLALSESPNQHEAEQAMAKASALMEEHQIVMSDVLVKEMKSAQAEKGKRFKVTEQGKVFSLNLASAVGLIFDTGAIQYMGGSIIRFIGLKDDVAQSEMLFDHLWLSWQSIVRQDVKRWKDDSYLPPRQYNVKKFKMGHGQGFANAIFYRAQRLARLRKEAVQASSSTGRELVVLKDQLVEQYYDDNNVKPARKRKLQTEGFGEGQVAGEAIPLGGGIEEGTKRERIN